MNNPVKFVYPALLSSPMTVPPTGTAGLLAVTVFLVACGGGGGGGDSVSSGEIGNPLPENPADDTPTGFSVDVPALTSDSFLIGNEILGEMVRYNPFSGAASTFSNLRQLDSYARYGESVDVAENAIIAVSDDNALNVLDMATGEFLWDIPLGIYQDTSIDDPSPPVCAENICYAMGSGGDLLAVDIRTKSVLWSTDLFPQEDNHMDILPLLVTQERIFAGGGRSSNVYGNVAYRLYVISRESGEVEQELDAGIPSMADDLLLISNYDLTAYDFDTLQPVWTLDLDLASTPAVVGDVIALHTVDSSVAESTGQRVIGVSRLDGSILWTREAGTMQSFFGPSTDGRLIYSTHAVTCSTFPCARGYPVALNPADGSLVWENEDVDIRQQSQPIVVEGHLLYDELSAFRDTGNGYNYERGVGSLNASNGAIEWISLGGYSFSSLTAIINGKAIRSSSEPAFVSER